MTEQELRDKRAALKQELDLLLDSVALDAQVKFWQSCVDETRKMFEWLPQDS